MIKIDKPNQEFLRAFSKSNEWQILRARLVEPLIRDIESVNSTYKFDEGFTAGEMFAGRQMASRFGNGLIKLIEMFNNDKAGTRKLEDSFE